eukprot:1161951-Pelagomonas_calceolata.AAC.1
MSPLHHKASRQNIMMLMGTLRVTRSTRFQNLAVRSIIVFNSTPCGKKPVSVNNRMGMQFASKFIGTLVDISIMSRCHLRVEMDGSPFDNAYKVGIKTALVSDRGASTVGKKPVRNT